MDTSRLVKVIPLSIWAFIIINSHPLKTSTLWYVSSSGNNSADCLSESTPCRTIQATINKAGSGDYIHAETGTYSSASNGETFPIIIDKSISINGHGAGLSIIDANSSGSNVLQSEFCVSPIIINGFTIRGGARGIEFIGSSSNCIQGSILNNTITANAIGIYLENSSFNITQNDIYANSSYGIQAFHLEGSIFRNSLAWNGSVGTSAIYYYQSIAGIINNVIGWNNGCGVLNRYSSPTITNNTIAFNYVSGIANWDSSNPAISNNIVVANVVYGIDQDPSSTPIKTYNDVWGNIWGDYSGPGGGTGSISADPRFVSWFDGHLLCSSPAINAGNNAVAGTPSNDFDGNPRPVGGIVDMGAYEKQTDLFCPVFIPFIVR